MRISTPFPSDREMHTLELREVSIEFPGVKALDNVSIKFTSNKVHALVGANGAGKSTLFKIIAGAYPHYTGKIILDGQNILATSPNEMIHSGIYCIYQEVETSLVPELTIAENLLLYEVVNTKKYQCFSWRRIYKEAQRIVASAGFTKELPDLKRKVSEISLSQRQLVAIARAINANALFILFDEPTSSLSSEDIKKLKEIIQDLKSRNIGVIFVSHRLEEVFSISDAISVLRNGRHVGDRLTAETTPEEIIKMILGRSLDEQYPLVPHKVQDETVLSVEEISWKNKVKNVSFSLRKGEILGIYGLVGAGKTELLHVIYGNIRPSSGRIKFLGNEVRFVLPKQAVERGIFLVPEERRRQGLFLRKSLKFNLEITNLDKVSTHGIMRRSLENNFASRIKEFLKIVASSVDQEVDFLSGGNQQKVIVGKWIEREGMIFLFDEPTKGIDVGAKSELYRIISQLASDGKSVIFVTPEIPEVLGLCDRVLVMFSGQIVAEFTKDTMKSKVLLAFATGGNKTW